MKVIGITGTSGSGKTTIAEILNKRLDVKVINADELAKSLTLGQTEYFEEIKEKFELYDILFDNGELNRKKLTNLIYGDAEKLKILNQITFKHLIPKMLDEIKNVDKSANFVVIDAPLLFEAKLDQYCDFIIAVIAPEELKINRICLRDNITEDIAKDRLRIQKSNEFYCKNANFVIENDVKKSEMDLEKKITEIFQNF